MKRVTLLLVVLLLMSVVGCGTAAPHSGTDFQFYYSTASDVYSGPAILSETASVTDATVPGLLERLFQDPVDLDLNQTIPKGTTVRSWSVQNGLLKLDLSEEFGKLSGVSLIRAESCIVLTVTQLDEVKRVAITVEGRRLPENGNRSMSADDVLLQGETEDPVTVGTRLYYPLLDGSGLEGQFRQMELASLEPVDQVNALLRELALVPSEHEDKLDRFLSGSGTIEAVSVKDGLCTLALDHNALEEICSAGSSEQQIRLRIYAIVDSLSELDDVSEVSFLLDGETIDGWQSVYSAQYEF